MGSGKSTIGRLLARKLKLSFVDSDHEIEKRTGADIPWIFDVEGESGFRDREERVIAEVTTRDDIVLATGGGAVIREANRRALAERGTVVYLQVSLDEQIARTRRDRNRPLLQGGDPAATLRRLMAERDPLYREVADHVVATSGQSARTVAQNLADLLREG
jgi:shikimate kinase